MTVIVTDSGFGPDDWDHPFFQIGNLPANFPPALAIDFPSDSAPDLLLPLLDRIDLIRIDFPSFADGRGFTIARYLRLMKYQGRLRAKGHIIADQYTMARRSGFDEIEIGPDMAARQPEAQWIYRANWQAHDYQTKLGARPQNPWFDSKRDLHTFKSPYLVNSGAT